MKGRAYRIDYQNRVPVSEWYSGPLHLAVINIACIIIAFMYWILLLPIHTLEWLMIPPSFIFANASEYIIHRYPMHRPSIIFGKGIYKKHSGLHHRMFTDKDMFMIESKDLREILTNPVRSLELFFLVILPVSILLSLIYWNLGIIFGITSVAYYLLFEWIHLASHMPKNHWLPSLPIIRSMCEHHRMHHDPRLMHKKNFNIAFPIFDKIMGTSAH